MRVRLGFFRPFLTAAGLLAVVVGGTELVLRCRESGTSVTHVDAAGLVDPSRTVHRALRPLRTVTLLNPDGDGPVEINVNSHGLRGGEIAVPKPPGVFRVLCLGDETLFAPALPEAQALPARLQQLLQERTRLRVEVLNGGVPGDCPLLAALRLRHSLLALQPDLVVLHFDMSDVADDQRCRRFTRLDRSETPIACVDPRLDKELKSRPWWADLRVVRGFVGLLDRSSGRGPAGGDIDEPRTATAWLRDAPPDWSVYVEQSLSPIEDLRRIADGTYAQLIVASCPQPWQVSAEASTGPGVREAAGVGPTAVYTSRAPFDAVAAFATARGVPFCDASPAFRDFPEPARLYLENAPQLSRFGQELYARSLGDFIAARLPAFGAAEGRLPNRATPPSADAPPTPTAGRDGPFYR